MEQEVWLPIASLRNRYYASSAGRVRGPRKILTPSTDSDGYLVFSAMGLYGARKTWKMHRVVAEVFCAGFFAGAQVNHKDGNKQNNLPSNLEWVTLRENCKHRCRELGLGVGEKNGQAKISEAQVKEIRFLYENGKKNAEIVALLGVSLHAVKKVLNGKTWKHLGFVPDADRAHGNSKLSISDVLAIKSLLKKNFTKTEIALRYGVSRPTISLIASEKNWKGR
jgi:hypothetical protein